MFEVLMFVCAINVPPSQCEDATAIHTLRGPVAPNEINCGLQSQAFLAQTAFAQNARGTYVKMRCARGKPGEVVAKQKPAAPRPAVVWPSHTP